MQFDRRGWLRVLALGFGGAAAPRRLFATSAIAAAPAALANPTVRLSLNENPYGPAPSVVAALQQEFTRLCRYSDVAVGGLLKSIAAKENVSEEHILLGEILEPLGTYLSLQGGSGGEFVYSDPGYTALIDSAAALGGTGIPVPLNPAMQNDLPAIAAKVNGRTRAVFLVNPHNPTGTVSDADEFRQFVRKTASRVLVIVDEAYLEFSDSFQERTLAGLVQAGDNVIVFRTFAKVYGLAGLDIGYGLLPKHIAQPLKKQGLDNPHLFNRLAVAGAEASLADTQYVSTVAASVAHERHIWLELLRELRVKTTASQGNFVFFETGIPHADFAAALLADGVEVGRSFPPYDLWARISIGLPAENAVARTAVRRLLGNKRQHG
jgi:histidinol-phosphate aminotransferase